MGHRLQPGETHPHCGACVNAAGQALSETAYDEAQTATPTATPRTVQYSRSQFANNQSLRLEVTYPYDGSAINPQVEANSGYRFYRDHDPAGRLSEIREAVGAAEQLIASYSHDELSRVNSCSTFHGTPSSVVSTGTLTFDKRGREATRLYANASTTIFSQTNFYDANGNPTSEVTEDHLASVVHGSRTFTHDAMNRLTNQDNDSDTGLPDAFWAYDATGNWLATDQNGAPENRTVNADNEFNSLNLGGGAS